MTRTKPPNSRRNHRTILRCLLIAAIVIIAASLLDRSMATTLRASDLADLNQHDWYRSMRVVGSLWFWLFAAAVVALHDRARHRAVPVALAPAVGGLFAELLKRITPRSRPFTADGTPLAHYEWRPLFSGFTDHHNLGFPSSHAAVAFAGCLCLAYLMPRARWAFYLLAGACAYSRVLSGAHYTSDVVAGALLGCVAARLLPPRNPSPAHTRTPTQPNPPDGQ